MGFIILFSFSQFYSLPNFTGDSCESCYDNTDVFNHLICLGQFVCWPMSILDSQLFDICRVFVFLTLIFYRWIPHYTIYSHFLLPITTPNTPNSVICRNEIFKIHRHFFSPRPDFFSALSCFKALMKPLSGHHGAANFRFDHQVYNIG